MSTAPARQFEVLPGNDRAMPSSEQAERHLIAAALLDGRETIARALQEGVTEKAFFHAANRLCWEVIVDLFRRQPPVTVEMLAEELATRRQLEAVGGAQYLLELTANLPTTAHVAYMIETLLEKSALRAAIAIGHATVERAHTYAGGGIDALFAEQLTQLSACVRHARRGSQLVSLRDRIGAVVAETTAAVEGTVDRSGWIGTGLPTFDERCLPFGCQAEDHLIVIAAGSGLGKSAIMRQVAGNAIAQGQRVRAYSRETSTFGFIEQLAATRGVLDLKHRRTWTKDMLTKFVAECQALEEVADKRLWCVENTAATPLLTVEDLEDDARYFAATQGAPHLWVVDYLQLFSARRRFGSREQEVAYVSHRLQALTRELGGVWLVGCQLNEKGLSEMRTLRRERTSEGKEGKVIHRLPNAGDLRESQAIYHDADRVIAHYLPPVDSRDQDQTGPNIEKPEVWLCQIKRRKGATGVVKCWFEKRYTRFIEQGGGHAAAAAPGVQPANIGLTRAQFRQERK